MDEIRYESSQGYILYVGLIMAQYIVLNTLYLIGNCIKAKYITPDDWLPQQPI